jgi:hypothetical protein
MIAGRQPPGPAHRSATAASLAAFSIPRFLGACTAARPVGFFTASIAAVLIMGTASTATAAAAPVDYVAAPDRPLILPVTSCESLATRDFTGIPDAPTSIASAAVEPADPQHPEFCVVKGYVAPQVQFVLHLPTKTYTGRYLQGGCGGACGKILPTVSPPCDTPRAFGGSFAVGFNNSGHEGASIQDAIWADRDPTLRVDFAYRATHVSSLAAKALITAYYGAPPALSYFQGCSDGGREGLTEAQRFPEDFVGIVVGAPAIWITPGVVRFLYEIQVATGPDHQPLLTPEAASLLHGAVMNACDALDGLKDGQIDDPRACHFDPRKLLCRAGRAPPRCLTAEQVEVVRKLYRGPLDDAGHLLYLGGETYGSELTWAQPQSLINSGAPLLVNQIRYMIFGGAPPSGLDSRDAKLDAQALRAFFDKGGYYDASNADLERFRQHGGKLILWQGAADSPAGPNVLLDYYQRLRDRAGGLEAARGFARVFVVPGVYHCHGGYIPFEEDFLGAMMSWVESGKAPESVQATALLEDGTRRDRPVFAYPVKARYKGSGDINSASSFTGAAPALEPDDHFEWLGAHLVEGSAP